jgi:hypothetical protein
MEQTMAKVNANVSKPGASEAASDQWKPRGRPTEWQAALLILRLVQAREAEFRKRGLKRNVSRARISQNTIRTLCGRSQISNDFLTEVQEYLLAAGWALFYIGPTYYGIIKLESVQGWSRISSKRIADDLNKVQRGEFKWEQYKELLMSTHQPNVDEENESVGDDEN